MRYLSLSSNGIWQFRYQIPQLARPLFGFRREWKTSLGSISKRAAQIKALQLEVEIRTKMNSLPLYDLPGSAMTQETLRQILHTMMKNCYDTISAALDLLERSSSHQQTLQELNQVQRREGLPANTQYRLDLRSVRSLSAVNEVYVTHLPPSHCAQNVMRQVKFVGEPPSDEVLDSLLMKMIRLFSLRLDARRALESLDFPRVKEILSELPLSVQDEEYRDSTLHDHKYVQLSKTSPVIASPKVPSSSTGVSERAIEPSASVSQSEDPMAELMPQPTVEDHQSKWHIEKVLEAYWREKLSLNGLNSDKAPVTTELDSALQRCRVIHELIGLDDVRLATRELAIKAAQLIKSLPRAPLQTKHKTLFEGKSRTEWADINQCLENPLPTLATRTTNGYMDAVSMVYKWAAQHYDPKTIINPWSGIIKKRQKGKKEVNERFPLDESDLGNVFSYQVFSQAKVGVNTRTKAPCAYQYWVPLLTLYGGLRGNEGAQLYRGDIKEEFGIPYIDVNEEREDQHLKNEHAIRKVPIHSRLIELGFLDYVALFEPDERLFPELTYYKKDHYYKNVGDWFTHTFSGVYKVHPERKSYYSLRHNAVGYFKEHIGESQPIIKALVGHSNASVTFDTYGTSVALHKLQEQVERLHFPAVPENIRPFFEGNYLQYQKAHRSKYLAMKLRQ